METLCFSCRWWNIGRGVGPNCNTKKKLSMKFHRFKFWVELGKLRNHCWTIITSKINITGLRERIFFLIKKYEIIHWGSFFNCYLSYFRKFFYEEKNPHPLHWCFMSISSGKMNQNSALCLRFYLILDSVPLPIGALFVLLFFR